MLSFLLHLVLVVFSILGLQILVVRILMVSFRSSWFGLPRGKGTPTGGGVFRVVVDVAHVLGSDPIIHCKLTHARTPAFSLSSKNIPADENTCRHGTPMYMHTHTHTYKHAHIYIYIHTHTHNTHHTHTHTHTECGFDSQRTGSDPAS